MKTLSEMNGSGSGNTGDKMKRALRGDAANSADEYDDDDLDDEESCGKV